jgi:hypothetical protein
MSQNKKVGHAISTISEVGQPKTTFNSESNVTFLVQISSLYVKKCSR